ncbi:PfkB family carbohydrate kinase [Faunimonas sp. B44]|uniref:PfkB family carbohydrate kinase n=1 Tax=Faunimonas sp. B44 TaxID=3461493 RepID=UPI004043CBC7
MIVAAGESLVDVAVRGTERGRLLLEAAPGGSPWNTALALGRLGAPAGFLGPIASDPFGVLLGGSLGDAGVKVLLEAASPRPTALAITERSESGEVAYRFHRTGTADRDLDLAALAAALPHSVTIYHTGSLALADEPEGETWADLALAAAERGALLSLDPNIRPGTIQEPGRYRDRLGILLDRTAIVRLSEEDLAYLVEAGDLAAARALFFGRHGCSLVALTCGARGAVLMTAGAEAWVDAHPPAVLVDTIGAGDTFTAAMLARIGASGCRTEADLRALSAEALAGIGRFAAAAAGLTCGRAGCDPPTAADVAAALGAAEPE